MAARNSFPLNEFVAAVREDITGWCVAAIVSSVLLLLVYSALPDVRRTPGWQFLFSSICEIYVAVGFLVLSLDDEAQVDPASGIPDVERMLCADYRMLVITVLAFDAAANNWRLLMYVDLIVVYHNPFRPNTARPLYHVLVSLTALAWATAISQKDMLCLDASGSINLSTLTWGLVYAPFLLFVLLGSMLYFAVYALLSRDRSNNPIARLARQRVMLHCLLYLLMYGLLLGLLAAGYANYALVRRTGEEGEAFFAHVTAALTVGRPVFGFVGWSLINRVPQRTFQAACCWSDAESAGARRLAPLQQPLLPTRNSSDSEPPGKGWLSRRQKPPQQPQPPSQPPLTPPERSGFGSEGAPGQRSEADSWLSMSQGVREAGFKEELRYELVSDVALAIHELAQREAREQHAAPPKVHVRIPALAALVSEARQERGAAAASASAGAGASAGSGGGARSGTGVSAGSGLGAGSGPPPGGPDGNSPPGTPARQLSGGLDPNDVSSPGLTSISRGTTAEGVGSLPASRVQHYAVAHFRDIRASFNISADFADAFTRSVPDQLDTWRPLRESVSEGASGSFFYWVKLRDGTDTGYIVKQITKREKDSLMSILPYYKAYVKERGGRSLLQYLSCHSMRLRWKWSGKVYFVVMRNCFPAPPQLSFDLKGATANRRALQTWELHGTASHRTGRYGTLRDWEWMDTGMTTDLNDEDKAQLWRMVQADCDFLQRQNLLDYSLLLGIYRPPDRSMDPASKEALLQDLARRCRGCAFVSHDRQKVYFFGIIDVLEKFTLRWRVQRVVLRLLYGLAMRWGYADGISAMPPPLYADRFRTFMAHEVLHVEEPPPEEPPDERYRAGSWWSQFKRWFGVGPPRRRPRSGGLARWQALWQRRRRGLVKQRIAMDHQDHIQRIKELEQHVQLRELELLQMRGAHPAVQMGACRGHERSSPSGDARAGSMSVGH